MTIGDTITTIVSHLEGDYKWYIIAAIILIIAAFITRFIFKTIKWFLVAVALGLVIFLAVLYSPSVLHIVRRLQ